MVSHAQIIGDFRQLGRLNVSSRRPFQPENRLPLCQITPGHRRSRLISGLRHRDLTRDVDALPEPSQRITGRRREFVLVPFLVTASGLLSSFATAKAEEQAPDSPASVGAVIEDKMEKEKEKDRKEEVDGSVLSRVYDATVIGEPQAVGKDRRKVWEKLLSARVVYLGEAEQVPDRDDRILELEIVRNLFSRCLEQDRSLSLAIEAFPCDLQEQVNQFMDGRSVCL